jgi:predicted MPP superfamily phosphohydrolase
VNSRAVTIKQVELGFTNLPDSFHNYKIVHISDIHLGTFVGNAKILKNSLQKIDELKPNMVFFTGDLVNNYGSEAKGWEKYFSSVLLSYPAFSILGNHDYGAYSNWPSSQDSLANFNEILQAHTDMGFELLRNNHRKWVKNNDTIYIIGVENWGHPPFPQLADLKKATHGIPSNSFEILLTHDPAHWEKRVKNVTNIELSLSGHTHGLQWGLKPAGIPVSLSYMVRNYWGGLYQNNKQFLYVTTGVGMVGIPWRIDMSPEIAVITLKRIEID